MKKSTRRILAFLSATAMALSLTACAGGNGGNDILEGENADGKLFAEGTTIDMIIPSHMSWPYNENWIIWDYMKEATGADFNIQAIPRNDYTTKLPLIMATPETLPDLLYVAEKPHVDDYALSGAYLSMDDNIDKLPNYQAFLDKLPETEREELLNQRKSGDGKMYTPITYGTLRVSSVRTWLYRKDIFEKHGLETPKTYEEMYQVAKKLKELYPNSYPICFREGLFRFEDTTAAWKNNFSYMPYYDQKEKEWKLGAQDPIMKDIIQYYLKLANENLVPPDYTTIQTKSWEELMTTDRGFITFDYAVRVDFFNLPCRETNPDYTLAVMAPPVPDVPTGSAVINKTNEDMTGWAVCNTGDKKGAENAFKFIDWMYTDEAVELLSWGKEGETYRVNADGKKEFILEGDEQAKTKYGITSYGTFQTVHQEAYESTYTAENIDSCVEALTYMEDQLNPTIWLAFNPEEQAVVSSTYDDLRAYCEENISKFLLGQKPLSEWDNFQKGLLGMGVDDLLNAYTSAYDRAVNK